jgi:predicted acylesterase/phospholipase RssA
MNRAGLAAVFSFFALFSRELSPQSPYTKPSGANQHKSSDTSRTKPRRPWSELDGAIPIASSFSGGISLGSYQSGVNWGLTQFLKYARANQQYRSQKHLPDLFFVALTGASAGNINAILSAVEYCDTRLNPPDSSLFWKAWISTGWPQLFARDRRGDLEKGLLDRRHFRDYIEQEVIVAMDRPSFLLECRIPIGIVVTRLQPGRIPLDTTIKLPAQRYVGMFEARVIHDSLRFTTPQDVLLGERLLGARLSLYHDSRVLLRPETVFDLVEASASYPIAFAAKPITYRDPDCQLYPPPYQPCDKWNTDQFIDGGVFDNNPVGLAWEMFDRRISQIFRCPRTQGPPTLRAFFTSTHPLFAVGSGS